VVRGDDLSDFSSHSASYNLLANEQFLKDAVGQSKQVLDICACAHVNLTAYLDLQDFLVRMRTIVTTIQDFVTIWAQVQHVWSSLYVAYCSHDAHKMQSKNTSRFIEVS